MLPSQHYGRLEYATDHPLKTALEVAVFACIEKILVAADRRHYREDFTEGLIYWFDELQNTLAEAETENADSALRCARRAAMHLGLGHSKKPWGSPNISLAMGNLRLVMSLV
ncbi:hypothetical protein K0U83_22430 [bacterium]|nr:hypothetical protein [bacterium]